MTVYCVKRNSRSVIAQKPISFCTHYEPNRIVSTFSLLMSQLFVDFSPIPNNSPSNMHKIPKLAVDTMNLHSINCIVLAVYQSLSDTGIDWLDSIDYMNFALNYNAQLDEFAHTDFASITCCFVWAANSFCCSFVLFVWPRCSLISFSFLLLLQ